MVDVNDKKMISILQKHEEGHTRHNGEILISFCHVINMIYKKEIKFHFQFIHVSSARKCLRYVHPVSPIKNAHTEKNSNT